MGTVKDIAIGVLLLCVAVAGGWCGSPVVLCMAGLASVAFGLSAAWRMGIYVL